MALTLAPMYGMKLSSATSAPQNHGIGKPNAQVSRVTVTPNARLIMLTLAKYIPTSCCTVRTTFTARTLSRMVGRIRTSLDKKRSPDDNRKYASRLALMVERMKVGAAFRKSPVSVIPFAVA